MEENYWREALLDAVAMRYKPKSLRCTGYSPMRMDIQAFICVCMFKFVWFTGDGLIARKIFQLNKNKNKKACSKECAFLFYRSSIA